MIPDSYNIDISKLKHCDHVWVDDAHKWGYQLRLVDHPLYAGKFLVLENNTPGSKHYHKKKTETFVVLKGEVFINAFKEYSWITRWFRKHRLVFVYAGTLKEGESITLPKKTRHEMRKMSDDVAVILEVSTKDDDEDIVRTEAE